MDLYSLWHCLTPRSSLMKVKDNYIISATKLIGYQQLFGESATQACRQLGYDYILVDDRGRIHALDKNNSKIEGYYVYLVRTYTCE